MFRLPSIKLKKSPSLEGGFLALTLDPFKVNLAYMEPNPADPLDLKILATRSAYISGDSLFQEAGTMEALASATQQILIDLEEEYSDLPRGVIFGLSSDCCIDLMSVVRYSRETGGRFSEESVEDLKEQAQKNALFRAQDHLAAQKGDLDTDLSLITSSDISFKIDGAPVRDPIGLEGKRLEFTWFGSFVQEPYLNFVRSLSKELRLKILAVSSLSHSFYTSLQQDSSQYRNCVVINLQSSLTEVYVAFGGSVVDTRFINMGTVSLIEEIADKLDLHYDEAITVLEKYKKGTLDSGLALEVQKIVRRFYIIWIKALNTVFADFAGIKTFSSKVLLTGPGFDIPDLLELVSTEPWFRSIPFKEPPNFEKGTLADKLSEVSDLTGTASRLEWSLLLSLSSVYMALKKEKNDI